MSQTVKSLKEQMKGLAEKKVKAYLESDLALDFERMAEGRVGQHYLWLLRECGTVMANKDWLAYSNNPDFGTISYYHPNQILAAYEVTVEAIEGEELSGSIRKISDYSSYYETLMKKAVVSDRVKIGVFLTNGEVVELEKETQPQGFNYYCLLEELQLKEEEVSNVRYLDFSVTA